MGSAIPANQLQSRSQPIQTQTQMIFYYSKFEGDTKQTRAPLPSCLLIWNNNS